MTLMSILTVMTVMSQLWVVGLVSLVSLSSASNYPPYPTPLLSSQGTTKIPPPPPSHRSHPRTVTTTPADDVIFSHQGDNNLYGSNVTSRFGNAAGASEDTSIFINTLNSLPGGRLSAFYAYVENPSENTATYMQIWRQQGHSNQSQLIWQASLPQMTYRGLSTIVLQELVCVQSGDFIGWTGKFETISKCQLSAEISVYTQTASDTSEITVGSFHAINSASFPYDFSIAVEVIHNDTTICPTSGASSSTLSQSSAAALVVNVPKREGSSQDEDQIPKSNITVRPTTTSVRGGSDGGGGGGTTPSLTDPPHISGTMDRTTIIIVAAIVVGGVVVITAAILAAVVVILRKRATSESTANVVANLSTEDNRQPPLSRVTSSSLGAHNSAMTIVDDVDTYDTVRDDGYTSLESHDEHSVLRRAAERSVNTDSTTTPGAVTSPGRTDVNGYLIILTDGDDSKEFSRCLSTPLPGVPYSDEASSQVVGGRYGNHPHGDIYSECSNEEVPIKRITSEESDSGVNDSNSLLRVQNLQLCYNNEQRQNGGGRSSDGLDHSISRPVELHSLEDERVNNAVLREEENNYLDLIY